MEQQFNQLNKKLDNLDSRLDGIDKTLIVQEANINEHMRRSDALEKLIVNIQSEIKPIQKHVNMVEGALKLVGGISIIATILKAFGVI